jgi:hypothetical protein
VLRAHAHADEPGRHAAQQREPIEQAQGPGHANRLVRRQDRPDQAVLHRELHALHHAHGPLSAALHPLQRGEVELVVAQRPRQQPRRGDGVLHGQVDADAADRRHRVRRVADAQQARPGPVAQPVHLHRQQLDLRVPVRQLAHALAQPRRQAQQGLVKRPDAAGAPGVARALGNQQRALPVVAARDHHQHAAGVDLAEEVRRIARQARDAQPQHVHRRAEVLRLQAGLGPDRRVAAVGAHHQRRAQLELAVGRPRAQAGDAAVLRQERSGLGLHDEAEVRQPAGVPREEVEEVPLRHHHQEPAMRRDVAEVGDPGLVAADAHRHLVQLVVRAAQELVEQAQLVHHAQRRWVDRVAAEITQEVGVLLEHDNVHAGPGEQETHHHAGRTAAGDHAIAFHPVHGTIPGGLPPTAQAGSIRAGKGRTRAKTLSTFVQMHLVSLNPGLAGVVHPA